MGGDLVVCPRSQRRVGMYMFTGFAPYIGSYCAKCIWCQVSHAEVILSGMLMVMGQCLADLIGQDPAEVSRSATGRASVAMFRMYIACRCKIHLGLGENTLEVGGE